MGKGRKRKDAARKAAQKWVLVYLDAYAFAEPAIVSDPMSYDDAMIALEKAKKSEGPDGFDSFEVWPAPLQ
jgi:hypothetical protein